MLKYLKNDFIKIYFILLSFLFGTEMLFKVISRSDLINYSTLRIFLGLSILSGVVSFILYWLPNLLKKILMGLLVFGGCFYGCVQLGFYNFLGLYMSFQTSSQLGAVVDYIFEFMLSFKWFYYLMLVPFVLLVLLLIFVYKKNNDEVKSLKKESLFLIPVIVISSLLYYGTIVLPGFQSKVQTISNKDLFLTASSPSLTTEEFGTIGYCILDFHAMLNPITIDNSSEFIEKNVQTITDNSRIIDDTEWNNLINSESNSEYKTLSNYFINRKISDKNEYTGMFKDKNLIVIMMESANEIFINKEYYPNFYKMYTEGWAWENNYSPRNSCATMNNEFSGMTSLFTIANTCTASKYKTNTYYESIFNLFSNNNYVTFSAHDYTQAYYPRKTIHTNMGSGEYYGVEKLGIDYSNEYKNWANDDDFMRKVLDIIDDKTLDKDKKNRKHFMTWLTTVSSHQPYSVDSIQGNKYLSLFKDLNVDTDVKRYMSKLKILDDALGILLKGLEEKGILDDTVIVMYGDHYPYGISTDHLNKILPYDTSVDLAAEQVPFVIYNSKLEPKLSSNYTSYINILPTINNLFGIEHDPRLYLGEDLMSDDYRSITIFADGTWKNEYAFYDAGKNKIKYYTDKTYTEEELKKINTEITGKLTMSSKAIKSNYFGYLGDKLSTKKIEAVNDDDNESYACENENCE